MEDLQKKFASLHNQLQDDLSKKNVPVKEILDSVTLLPVELKLEYDESIQAKLPDVMKVQSRDQLFYHLNPLFTYIDYRLLEYLISKFGTTELQKNMKEYIKEVDGFMCKTTVGDVMPYWPGKRISSEEFSELWVKIEANPETYSLHALSIFRDKHCATIKLSAVLSSIKSLTPTGSFLAMWLIPKAATIDVTKAVDFYKDEQVSMVILDIKQLHLSDTANKVKFVVEWSLQSIHPPRALCNCIPTNDIKQLHLSDTANKVKFVVEWSLQSIHPPRALCNCIPTNGTKFLKKRAFCLKNGTFLQI